MAQSRSDLVNRLAQHPLVTSGEQMRERRGGPLVGAGQAPMHMLDAAAMLTSPIPGLGDVVGVASDIRAIRKNPTPENITLAAIGALPFVPSGLRIIRNSKEVPEQFRGATEEAIRMSGADKPISRDVIVEMTPDEFLRFAEQGEDIEKMRKLEGTLGKGERLRHLPFLILDDTGEAAGIVGHEGRHRVKTLAKRGEKKIPVRISRKMGRGDKLPGEVLPEDAFETERILKRAREAIRGLKNK